MPTEDNKATIEGYINQISIENTEALKAIAIAGNAGDIRRAIAQQAFTLGGDGGFRDIVADDRGQLGVHLDDERVITNEDASYLKAVAAQKLLRLRLSRLDDIAEEDLKAIFEAVEDADYVKNTHFNKLKVKDDFGSIIDAAVEGPPEFKVTDEDRRKAASNFYALKARALMSVEEVADLSKEEIDAIKAIITNTEESLHGEAIRLYFGFDEDTIDLATAHPDEENQTAAEAKMLAAAKAGNQHAQAHYLEQAKTDIKKISVEPLQRTKFEALTALSEIETDKPVADVENLQEHLRALGFAEDYVSLLKGDASCNELRNAAKAKLFERQLITDIKEAGDNLLVDEKAQALTSLFDLGGDATTEDLDENASHLFRNNGEDARAALSAANIELATIVKVAKDKCKSLLSDVVSQCCDELNLNASDENSIKTLAAFAASDGNSSSLAEIPVDMISALALEALKRANVDISNAKVQAESKLLELVQVKITEVVSSEELTAEQTKALIRFHDSPDGGDLNEEEHLKEILGEPLCEAVAAAKLINTDLKRSVQTRLRQQARTKFNEYTNELDDDKVVKLKELLDTGDTDRLGDNFDPLFGEGLRTHFADDEGLRQTCKEEAKSAIQRYVERKIEAVESQSLREQENSQHVNRVLTATSLRDLSAEDLAVFGLTPALVDAYLATGKHFGDLRQLILEKHGETLDPVAVTLDKIKEPSKSTPEIQPRQERLFNELDDARLDDRDIRANIEELVQRHHVEFRAPENVALRGEKKIEHYVKSRALARQLGKPMLDIKIANSEIDFDNPDNKGHLEALYDPASDHSAINDAYKALRVSWGGGELGDTKAIRCRNIARVFYPDNSEQAFKALMELHEDQLELYHLCSNGGDATFTPLQTALQANDILKLEKSPFEVRAKYQAHVAASVGASGQKKAFEELKVAREEFAGGRWGIFSQQYDPEYAKLKSTTESLWKLTNIPGHEQHLVAGARKYPKKYEGDLNSATALRQSVQAKLDDIKHRLDKTKILLKAVSSEVKPKSKDRTSEQNNLLSDLEGDIQRLQKQQTEYLRLEQQLITSEERLNKAVTTAERSSANETVVFVAGDSHNVADVTPQELQQRLMDFTGRQHIPQAGQGGELRIDTQQGLEQQRLDTPALTKSERLSVGKVKYFEVHHTVSDATQVGGEKIQAVVPMTVDRLGTVAVYAKSAKNMTVQGNGSMHNPTPTDSYDAKIKAAFRSISAWIQENGLPSKSNPLYITANDDLQQAYYTHQALKLLSKECGFNLTSFKGKDPVTMVDFTAKELKSFAKSEGSYEQHKRMFDTCKNQTVKDIRALQQATSGEGHVNAKKQQALKEKIKSSYLSEQEGDPNPTL